MNTDCLVPKDADKPPRGVRALLFADVKGFSKMREQDGLEFFRRFHAGAAEHVLAPRAGKILVQNTWGDALHVVMEDLAEAGRLALDLQDWMSSQDWLSAGFETDPKLRVGLHAGVVTRIPDPVIRAFNYTGRNTSRAARIEPIAFEGQVFASAPYAALLALENPPDLALEYVGCRTLPKGAGELAVFVLSRYPVGD
jgi:class 3 adenylate cyclase